MPTDRPPAENSPVQRAKPTVVGWDERPPESVGHRRSAWDDALEDIRDRTDGKWGKIHKGDAWHSTTLSSLRKSNPDLEFEHPTLRRGRKPDFVWARRKPTTETAEGNGQP